MNIRKQFKPHQQVNVFQKTTGQLTRNNPVLLTSVSSNTFCGIDSAGNERIFDFILWLPEKIKRKKRMSERSLR